MVTWGQAASVPSAGASVAGGVPVGAGVGAGTSTRWPTVRKHWVPRLLSSIIERTETSKKKAMLRQLSPSLTVYSVGGSGVGEGTVVEVGGVLGPRRRVGVQAAGRALAQAGAAGRAQGGADRGAGSLLNKGGGRPGIRRAAALYQQGTLG